MGTLFPEEPQEYLAEMIDYYEQEALGGSRDAIMALAEIARAKGLRRKQGKPPALSFEREKRWVQRWREQQVYASLRPRYQELASSKRSVKHGETAMDIVCKEAKALLAARGISLDVETIRRRAHFAGNKRASK